MNRTAPSLVLSVCLSVGLPAAERQFTVQSGVKQVKRYEKIEFSFDIAPLGANPYDSAEIACELDLTAPSGRKITIPAFYYQSFERQRIERRRRRSEWLYPVGEAVWAARFAPAEVGTYSGQARCTDRRGQVRSAPITFESLPSGNRGFVRVSPRDIRFLEFAGGSAFFPIGQNVAFVRDVYETEAIFRKMAAQGANYARVWACCEDWAMAIEARKSAWGRSWAWDPPIVAMPGREGYHSGERCVRIAGGAGAAVNVFPSHRLALRPDTKYRISGRVRTQGASGVSLEIGGVTLGKPIAGTRDWVRFEHEFTSASDQWWLERFAFRLAGDGIAWLRDLSLREAKGGPELLWEADVNRPPRGYYNPLDCFMLDKVVEAAERHGMYLQLVLLTRDHYMDLLKDETSGAYEEAITDAKRLLRYAVARWGYSTHVAAWEYFNEMNPRLSTDRFYSELGDYLENVDPYNHLRATSAWGPSKKDWRHPGLDTADMHYYLRPATGGLFKDAVESVRQRTAVFLGGAAGKPALFSEFGMTADNWQRSPRLDDDKEYIHLHNALWASALSGLSGSVLSWFWEDIEKKNMYHHYHPLATFLADIPFTTAGLRSSQVAASDKRVRVIGLQGKDCAYLWLSDSQATWWNLAVEDITPSEIAGASLVIDDLQPGTYRVQWWDTWNDKTRGQEEVRTQNSKLAIKVPAFTRDIACKIAK